MTSLLETEEEELTSAQKKLIRILPFNLIAKGLVLYGTFFNSVMLINMASPVIGIHTYLQSLITDMYVLIITVLSYNLWERWIDTA